jgi:hypothetical protein
VALTQLSEREVLAVEESISPFIASVIPVHQMGAVHVTDKHNLIVTVVHTLTQAALIRLYYLRGEVDQLRSEKCLLAARGILLLIGQVSDMDIAFLDPIVGVSPRLPTPRRSLSNARNVSVPGPLGVSCPSLHSRNCPGGVLVAYRIQRTRRPRWDHHDRVATCHDLR